MRKSFGSALSRQRKEGPSDIRQILQQDGRIKQWRRRKEPKYLKGVSNGNFFKIRIEQNGDAFPNLPSFPSILPAPAALQGLLGLPSKVSLESIFITAAPNKSVGQKIWNWMVLNWPTMLLNAGSLCTLLAFTRTDVLELRTLSATGSISNAIYRMTQKPFLWITVAWPSVFASVNGYKIMEILHERNANVRMNEEQERIFVEHFMQHGITPKQFERIERAATVVDVKKGQAIISKGQRLDHVYLVVHGSTQAHIKGRRLSAQSTSSKTKGDQKLGGDSGAWVGEMKFLDRYWQDQQKKAPSSNASGQQDEAANSKGNFRMNTSEAMPDSAPVVLYSVLASKDCVVWAWSYDDMSALVSSSTDMRGALTRAMTSAIVGKVVNMTVSRTKAIPTWSAWLSDWSRDDGARVNVDGIEPMAEVQELLDEESPDVPELEPDRILQ